MNNRPQLILLTSIMFFVCSVLGANGIDLSSMSKYVSAPNQSPILGYGMMESKLHLFILLFMGCLFYIGHKKNVTENA